MNKKGFVLAETLVVTIFVLLIFSTLYTSIVPLLGRYKELSYYDDLDTTYDVYQYKKLIEKDAKLNEIITNKDFNNNGFLKINCSNLINMSECDKLDDIVGKTENDTLMYLNTNNISKIKNNPSVSDEIKDYLDYINLDNKKILLLELNGYISYVEFGNITNSEIKLITVKYHTNITDSNEIDKNNLFSFDNTYNVNINNNINIQIPEFDKNGTDSSKAVLCRKSDDVYASDGTKVSEKYHGYKLLGLSDISNATTKKYDFGKPISLNNVTEDKTINLYAVWQDQYATGTIKSGNQVTIRKENNVSAAAIATINATNQTVTFLTSAYVKNNNGEIWYRVKYNNQEGYIISSDKDKFNITEVKVNSCMY